MAICYRGLFFVQAVAGVAGVSGGGQAVVKTLRHLKCSNELSPENRPAARICQQTNIESHLNYSAGSVTRNVCLSKRPQKSILPTELLANPPRTKRCDSVLNVLPQARTFTFVVNVGRAESQWFDNSFRTFSQDVTRSETSVMFITSVALIIRG